MNLTSSKEGREGEGQGVEGVEVTDEDWEERSSTATKEAGVVT